MSDQSYVVVYSVYTDLDELDATLFQELLMKSGIPALLIPIGETLKRLTFGGLGNTRWRNLPWHRSTRRLPNSSLRNIKHSLKPGNLK